MVGTAPAVAVATACAAVAVAAAITAAAAAVTAAIAAAAITTAATAAGVSVALFPNLNLSPRLLGALLSRRKIKVKLWL